MALSADWHNQDCLDDCYSALWTLGQSLLVGSGVVKPCLLWSLGTIRSANPEEFLERKNSERPLTLHPALVSGNYAFGMYADGKKYLSVWAQIHHDFHQNTIISIISIILIVKISITSVPIAFLKNFVKISKINLKGHELNICLGSSAQMDTYFLPWSFPQLSCAGSIN